MSQTEDECIHLIYPPLACTICHPKPKKKIRLEPEFDFRAKFQGHCAGCKDSWDPGEIIRRWKTDDHDDYIYTHQECDPNAD